MYDFLRARYIEKWVSSTLYMCFPSLICSIVAIPQIPEEKLQSNEFIKYFIIEYMSQNELNLAAIRDIFIACQLRDASNQCNCTGTKVREKSNQIKSIRKIIKMIHCNFIKTDINKNKRKMHAYLSGIS